MKIEIWSDFLCPFCYIGKRRLEKALENFPHRESVFIEYKSYLIDPDAKYNPDKNYYETFAELKGVSIEEALALNKNVREQGLNDALDFHFENMKYTNTFDAHRLLQYAKEKNIGSKLAERFLFASFTEEKLLSDHRTLIMLAKEVGLDASEVQQLLESKRYTRRVNEDIEEARQIGVEAVPFFVFNEVYAVPEIQTAAMFQAALEKVWEEEQKTPVLQSAGKVNSKTSYCTGDSCE